MALSFSIESPNLGAMVAQIQGDIERVQEELIRLRQVPGQENRCKELEEETSALLNRYVVAQRLHTSRDFECVMNSLVEILEALVGVARFVTYLAESPTETTFLKIIEDDEDEPRFEDKIERDKGVLGEAVRNGTLFVESTGRTAIADGSRPIALVPLELDGTVVGLLAIYRLFEHKGGFNDVDTVVFEMLRKYFAPVTLQLAMDDIRKGELQSFEEVVRNARNVRTLSL